MLVLAPDSHSAYGELVSKYFVAQGLAADHTLAIVSSADWVKECMWIPGKTIASGTNHDDDDPDENETTKVKIAWRYESMGQFQTTVSNNTSEDFCKTFDLTVRIPDSVLEDVKRSGRLTLVDVNDTFSHIEKLVRARTDPVAPPLRICIPFLGSPEWGDMKDKDLLLFLHRLRHLLKNNPSANVCAFVSLSPHLCQPGESPWTQKLGWISDACVELRAFGANPALTSLFPSHHGLLSIHSLPAPHSLLAPSDKYSTLRAVHASGDGGGENNLAFKCMRKRLVFETLHLDIEGGVGERRTTPASNVSVLEVGLQEQQHEVVDVKRPVESKVEIQLEGMVVAEEPPKPKKKKKAVVFHSDRPELYDF